MKISGTRIKAVMRAALLTRGQMQGIPPQNAVPAAAASSDRDSSCITACKAGTIFSGNEWDNDESFYKALPHGNGHISRTV